MNQPELFTDQDMVDPEILKAVKDMRRFLNFPDDLIESLFSHRLKITGRSELIPTFKRQMEIIRKKT